jgi:hypothetical protein
LIEVAKPYLLEDAKGLRDLLAKWSEEFGMPDPLLNDLGTHRWLDKETSYSNWLAWVLERPEPSAVFEVLGVAPALSNEGAGRCKIERESPMDERFIDLLVRFDGRADYAIGVEVKAYDQQFAKLGEYRESLRKRFNDPPCVLITIDEIPEDQRYGFSPRLWRQVAFGLRGKIAEYSRKNGAENRIVTAMMLGFVAAVEQNLLAHSPAVARRARNNRPTPIPEDLVEYLRGDK